MKIALLGYGKMGKEIEQLALAKNHRIILKVDVENAENFSIKDFANADVAIEFSTPSAAFGNILKCFDANIPVVIGTTGWLDKLAEAKKICTEKNQAMFYASNYSVGVNLFFEINKKLASLMNGHDSYDICMEEIHHTQKLDAPSGTAISLANDIIENLDRKTKWVNKFGEKKPETISPQDLVITSLRKEHVPGTHTVVYQSEVDEIKIKHIAHSRKGFASGALLAAEWIVGKKGIFGMQDLLKL
jgi:4-hydroxy-tetrahydrodipicolinate reductase